MSNATTLTHTNGATPRNHSTPWSDLSVQQFFQAVNWEDNSPEIQEIKLNASQGEGMTLSMLLTVSQFFTAVNWDGTTIAAASTPNGAAKPQPLVSDQLTLDDFSQLF
jgi:hypothetical protein